MTELQATEPKKWIHTFEEPQEVITAEHGLGGAVFIMCYTGPNMDTVMWSGSHHGPYSTIQPRWVMPADGGPWTDLDASNIAEAFPLTVIVQA